MISSTVTSVVTPTPTIEITPSATPTPTVDVTADWKTYTNQKLGIQFKYPQDYVVSILADGSVNLQKDPTRALLYINVQDDPNNLSPRNFLQNELTEDPSIKAVFDNNTFSDVQIGSISALRLDKKESASGYQDFSVSTFYNGKLYNLNFGPKDSEVEIANQILSTFNFTGTSPSPTTTITTTDQQTLKSVVQNKVYAYGKSHGLSSIDQVIITINKFQSDFASGITGFTPEVEGSGDNWYAAKVNGQWQVVEETQEPASCQLMAQYQFPKEIYGECVNK